MSEWPSVLLVHNHYRIAGGEDAVFEAESALLESNGHRVMRFTAHNDRLEGLPSLQLLRLTLWNKTAHSEIRALLKREKPDLVHFHNLFPWISPSAYYAVKEAGIPIVQTLHNYRLLCPNALLLHKNHSCEACLGKAFPWPGILRACYRESRAATAAVASMLTLHRFLGTWKNNVDRFIALSEFSKNKFVKGGLPADKIVVKPNFAEANESPASTARNHALFVGRLSSEKGLEALLEAWRALDGTIPLKILGDGPLRGQMKQNLPAGVEWLGQGTSAEVNEWMARAAFLVFPSICFENFPKVVIEAFAKGTPLLVARGGAAAEIVEEGQTGLHFAKGDALDLATKAIWAWYHPAEMQKMGDRAKQEFASKYGPEENYRQLLGIYRTVLAQEARALPRNVF